MKKPRPLDEDDVTRIVRVELNIRLDGQAKKIAQTIEADLNSRQMGFDQRILDLEIRLNALEDLRLKEKIAFLEKRKVVKP